MPGWTSGAGLSINGEPVATTAAPGSYLELTRAWAADDRVTLDVPMALRTEPLSDRPDLAALTFGPVVLAQQLPAGRIPAELMTEHGPRLDKAPPPLAAASLPGDITTRLRPMADQPLAFETEIDGRRTVFRPVNESSMRYAAYSTIG